MGNRKEGVGWPESLTKSKDDALVLHSPQTPVKASASSMSAAPRRDARLVKRMVMRIRKRTARLEEVHKSGMKNRYTADYEKRRPLGIWTCQGRCESFDIHTVEYHYGGTNNRDIRCRIKTNELTSP